MSGQKSMTRELMTKASVFLIILLIAGTVIRDHVTAWILGVLLGGIFTLIKIKLMEITMERALTKEAEGAKRYVQAHFMLRYVLNFIVMLIGIVTPAIDIIAVILSLLTLKGAAYWQGLNEPHTPLDGSVEFLEWEDDDEPTDF